MQWFRYSDVNPNRFDEAARAALDALAAYYEVVEIGPPSKAGASWNVRVGSSVVDPFDATLSGQTLADAAHRLANWRGVDVPILLRSPHDQGCPR